MEAFLFAGQRLQLYLSLLFNMFLMYGYIPDAFHQSAIIPLVKCKSGDLSDVSNYRAITLSNSVSKLLETVLFKYVESHDSTDDYHYLALRKIIPHLCVLMSSKNS